MTTPFDARQDLADAPRVVRDQKPRDAATLILLRGDRVLMGRRAPGHVFMPSKWVFPGGRLERSDFTAASTGRPDGRTAARLDVQMPARRGRALMLTAVRETFEETGLVLGAPAPPASVAGPWRAYRQSGALPDLSALTYVARAITPPGRARRFDARFFVADASSLLHPEPTQGCGELDEIAWFPLDEAERLDLPAITRFVLGEVRDRLDDPDRPPPFVRMVRGRHLVTRA
ncbi:NUDIX hydrolase [Brevundimonas sp. PAMC22021]|uniref:NUDIX hydrolase n=1 Tax=Brevundimonas sp. PAMC22021 TaxID=2861285 RepID=UPI001C637D86|nr:NUDIX hydrolase [Brevundimonas sp. PAMC22021]QYF88159.1 NUDIX hydrolase [Brevundimonas sp. PAMC22021]